MGKYSSLVQEGLAGSLLDEDERQPKITNPTQGTISAANIVSSADTETGLPTSLRVGLSMKASPKERTSMLEEMFGVGKVLDIDGEDYVFKDGNWLKVDEEGFSGLQDLGDLAGPFVGLAPGALASIYTANPYAVGAAEVGGDALRQALGMTYPGGSDRTWTDRATQSVLAGIIGGATQGVFNTIGKMGSHIPGIKSTILEEGRRGQSAAFPMSGDQKVLDVLVPNPGRQGSKEFVEAFGDEAIIPPGERTGVDQMAETVGMRLPMGDLSQNPYLKRIEGALRQHGRAETVFNQIDRQNERALYDYLKKISSGVDPEVAGEKIKSIGQNYFDGLLQRRRTFAGEMFNQAAEESGGAKMIAPSNYYNAIKDLSSEYLDNPIVSGFDPMVKKATEFENVANNLFTDSASKQEMVFDPKTLMMTTKTTRSEPVMKEITVSQLQKGLQSLGDIAAGKGKLMEDLTTAEQRRFASHLKSALEKDMDEAINSGVPGAETLRKARDRWKKYTNLITNNENTRLARDLEKNVFGEELINNIINGKLPAKYRGKIFSYLKKHSPESVADLKRVVFQRILEGGVPSGSGAGKMGAPFSPSKGLTELIKRGGLLEDMYKGDAAGWLELQNAITGMKVLSSRMGMSGSQTAPMQWAMEIIKQSKFNPVDLLNSFMSYRRPEAMARMLTGGGYNSTREALAELAKPKVKTKAFLRALENMMVDSKKYELLDKIGEYGNVPETRNP